MKQWMTFLTAAAGLGWMTAGSAANFIVNSTADVADQNPGDGVCQPINAVGNTCTLRAAIMEANELAGSHTILLASGTYSLTNTGIDEDNAVTGDLDIVGNITIINGTNNPPTISGNFTDRVFDLETGATLTLENVIVTGGQANDPTTTRGGAFDVADGATLNLTEVQVVNNVGNIGGAIYSDGFVTINESEFVENVITDDNVNTSFADGAAILNRGTLLIDGSTFLRNGKIPGGEGLFLTGEYAIEARQGFVAGPQIQITNSTFHDNTAGIFADGVDLVLINVTISRNGARGLRFLKDLGDLGSTQLAVSSTVIAGHTTDCNGLIDDTELMIADNANASSDDTCGFAGAADFENIGYPFFDELDSGTGTRVLIPLPHSVIVDSPDATCSFAEDQRGVMRPQDGDEDGMAFCDIGAVEYDPANDPVLPDLMFADGFEN